MEKTETILELIWLLMVSGVIGAVIIGMWNDLGAETALNAGVVVLAFILFGYILRDFISKLK